MSVQVVLISLWKLPRQMAGSNKKKSQLQISRDNPLNIIF